MRLSSIALVGLYLPREPWDFYVQTKRVFAIFGTEMGYGDLGRYTLCTKSKKKDKGSNSHRKKVVCDKKDGQI